MLLGDTFIKPGLFEILTPFAFSKYKPINVGIGQLGFYMWLILVTSFYLKKIIGRRIWRGLHYIGFLAFLTGLIHGITSGSDSDLLWMQLIYWLGAASVLFLTFYCILIRAKPNKSAVQ